MHWSDIVAAAVQADWNRQQEWDARNLRKRQRPAERISPTVAPRSCEAMDVVRGGLDRTGVLYNAAANDAVSRQYESTPPHANRNDMEQEES